MLEDRDYMRQPDDHGSGWRPGGRPRWSWTVVFLIAYAVVFVAEQLFPNNILFQGRHILTKDGVEIIPGYLPLSVEGIAHGYVWQLLTYQFMHSGWLHILGNSWVIYVFGREVESILGGRKFLALMISSGILGGVFQVFVAFVWPQYFGAHMEGFRFFSGEVVGASACAFGLVAAYAMFFPERELTMLLLFIIPVHMRAKTLLIGSAVLAVTGFAFPNVIMPGVAHAAHLGGMAMGWFFVRKILQGDWSRLGGALRPAEKRRSSQLKTTSADENPESGYSEEQVNAILDKISAQGIQSLSRREREILESARKQMGKR